MNIIYLMIPLGILLLGLAVWALVWAVRSGQFDDLESHGWDPVLDDDRKPPPSPSDPEEDSG
jgi:cbb3-type cytochrome oxidase maturation protein